MEIQQVGITAQRVVDKDLIICRRNGDWNEMKRRLADHVKELNDEKEPPNKESYNKVYAFQIIGEELWSRVMLRHFNGKVPVLHRLDGNGVFDFNPSIHRIREIKDTEIKEKTGNDFKLFIYGIHKIWKIRDFKSMFDSLIKDQNCTAIFTLVEEKDQKCNEAFAGDILYSVNGKFYSFREVLLRNEIARPACVEKPRNKRLFEERAQFLSLRNLGRSLINISSMVSENTAIESNFTIAPTQNPNMATVQNFKETQTTSPFFTAQSFLTIKGCKNSDTASNLTYTTVRTQDTAKAQGRRGYAIAWKNDGPVMKIVERFNHGFNQTNKTGSVSENASLKQAEIMMIDNRFKLLSHIGEGTVSHLLSFCSYFTYSNLQTIECHNYFINSFKTVLSTVWCRLQVYR